MITTTIMIPAGHGDDTAGYRRVIQMLACNTFVEPVASYCLI